MTQEFQGDSWGRTVQAGDIGREIKRKTLIPEPIPEEAPVQEPSPEPAQEPVPA
jgi:hypothetical protein